MNPKHAAYVLAVLETGSITAAARKLHISQPSLSQTLKQIERGLGAPVLERGGDTPRLTPAGEAYVEAARQVLAIEQGLNRRVAEIRGEVHGTLTLGLSLQLSMSLLPQVLPAFAAQYPRVRVRLLERGSEPLEQLAMEGACDIALIMTAAKDNHLAYTLLKEQRLVLIASKSTTLAQTLPDGTEIDITEAVGERFVALTPGHSVRALQEHLFSRYQIAPDIYTETDNLEVAKRLAASCGVVTLSPHLHAVSTPELLPHIHCYPVRSSYERHLYCCHLKETRLEGYLRAFVDIIRARL